MKNTTSIADGLYRISFIDEPDLAEFTFPGFSYNLFLIDAERPVIVNTMFRRTFERLKAEVSTVLDPRRLEYVVVPHHVGDSSGALNQWLGVAPQAVPVCSQMCCALSLLDYSERPPVVVTEDQTLDLGSHRLRFLMTPHIDQWDSMMVYEETTGTLFPNDLFSTPGPDATADSDVSDVALAVARQAGYQADDHGSLASALDKISHLDVRQLAVMHGPTIRGHVDELVRAFRDNALSPVPA